MNGKLEIIKSPIPTTYDLSQKVSEHWTFNGNTFTVYLSVPDYYKYVDEGRRKGSFPNVSAIENWIETKNIVPYPINGKIPTIQQLSYLIGRKIERDGIEPKNYTEQFRNELDMDKITQLIKEVMKSITEKELRDIWR